MGKEVVCQKKNKGWFGYPIKKWIAIYWCLLCVYYAFEIAEFSEIPISFSIVMQISSMISKDFL